MNTDSGMQSIRIRPACREDLPSLVALERRIQAAMDHPEAFAIDDEAFYVPIIEGAGSILLAEADGAPAGAGVIRFPAADDPENLGRDAGLPAALMGAVRHLESMFIDPGCRMRGLASALLKENMLRTAASGRWISAATAWPGNVPSLRLLFHAGLTGRRLAFKYGGLPRLILMCDWKPVEAAEVQAQPGGPKNAPCIEETAAAGDFDRLARLFALGFECTGISGPSGRDAILLFRKTDMRGTAPRP